MGSFLYTLLLNFKQSSLFYSLGIFFFILMKIVHKSNLFTIKRKIISKNLLSFLYEIIKVGTVVLITTLVLWFPWLKNFDYPYLY